MNSKKVFITVAVVAVGIVFLLPGDIRSVFLYISGVPYLRSLFWKYFYNFLATTYRNQVDITFMNYGFLPLTEYEKDKLNFIKLRKKDKKEAIFSNLYQIVVSDVQESIKDSKILEVGSGRGGGASFMTRYFQPSSYTGVDFSDSAISLSSERYKNVSSLSFRVGNAEKLPFKSNTFDFVINVESSHCYANVTQFFSEVHRVLRKGGHFLMADFRGHELMDDLSKSLKSLPWGEDVIELDITSNVFAALKEDDARKREKINELASLSLLRNVIGEVAGISGSGIFEGFRQDKVVYHRFVSKK